MELGKGGEGEEERVVPPTPPSPPKKGGEGEGEGVGPPATPNLTPPLGETDPVGACCDPVDVTLTLFERLPEKVLSKGVEGDPLGEAETEREGEREEVTHLVTLLMPLREGDCVRRELEGVGDAFAEKEIEEVGVVERVGDRVSVGESVRAGREVPLGVRLVEGLLPLYIDGEIEFVRVDWGGEPEPLVVGVSFREAVTASR